MSGFIAVNSTDKLSAGLYKVVIPLFGVEKPVLKGYANTNTIWDLQIKKLEWTIQTATVMSQLHLAPADGFRFHFPRSSILNPKTGLDQAGGAYLVRKGYDDSTGSFWCLVAVKSADGGSRVDHLFSRLLINLDGLLGPRRVASTGPIHFYKYVVTASQPAQSVQTQPTTAQPITVPPSSTGGSLGYLFGVKAGSSLFGVNWGATYPLFPTASIPATSGAAATKPAAQPAVTKAVNTAAVAVKVAAQQQPVPVALLAVGGLVGMAYFLQRRGGQ